jgi:Uma2 family endonuclease
VFWQAEEMNALPMLTPTTPMTIERFLAFVDTRPIDERWELIDGLPMMSNMPRLRHEIVCGNITDVFSPIVRRQGCRVLRQTLLRRLDREDFAAVPDMMIRCGVIDGGALILDDPMVLFEVLSPSTEGYDRRIKLRHYMAMPSVRHIVIIYPHEVRIEHHARTDDAGWPLHPTPLTRLSHVLSVPEFGIEMPLRAVYDGLDLSDVTPA